MNTRKFILISPLSTSDNYQTNISDLSGYTSKKRCICYANRL